MILGISIIEEQVNIKCQGIDNVRTIPFAICKMNDKSFDIGRRAYEHSLNNKGILVDKLLSKAEKQSKVLIDNTEYHPYQLLEYFFRVLFLEYDNIEFITVCLSSNNINVVTAFDHALSLLLVTKEKYKITTFSDCYIRYIRNIENLELKNNIGLIDFSNKSLMYYEMKIVKNNKNKDFLTVNIIKHPPISLELLSKKTGIVVCDNMLNTFAKTVTHNKSFDMFLLTGEGFENQDLYRDFINTICSLDCSVVKEDYLFAIGAELISEDIVNKVYRDDYYYITDNRTDVSIKFDMQVDNELTECTLIDFGEEWIDNKVSFEIIVYDIEELKFKIFYINGEMKELFIKFLDNITLRDNRTTKLLVNLEFHQQRLLCINVSDNGFGDFYEKTDQKVYIDDKEI